MTNLNESFNASLASLVSERTGDSVESIVDYDDVTVYGGYCNTCAYEYAVVDVTYMTSAGEEKEYRYDGAFIDLVRTLLSLKK